MNATSPMKPRTHHRSPRTAHLVASVTAFTALAALAACSNGPAEPVASGGTCTTSHSAHCAGTPIGLAGN